MKKTTLLLGLVLPFMTFAGGFQLNVQSVKAVGMGGAFSGLGSDASSVFFNPGAMTNLSGQNVTLGVHLIDPAVSLQTPMNHNINQTTGMANPIHMYYVGQFGEKLRVGMQVNNQFGSSSSFEDDWQGKYIVQNISLRTFMYQPTVAYSLHEKISIGAGFVFTSGSFSYEKAVPVGSSATPYGKAALEGAGTGIGYNVGLFSNLISFGDSINNTKLTLGVNYRSGIKIDLPEGEATFSNIPSPLVGKFPNSTAFTSELNLPSVFTFGLGVKHTMGDIAVQLAYDFNMTGWSTYDTLAFDFANEETPDSKTIKNWQNASTHRVGLEGVWKNKYALRLGLYADQTPIEDGYVSPELPDATQVAYTAGLGYIVNDKISVDLSILRQKSERESELIQEGFTAKYNRVVFGYGVGVNIHL